MTGPATISRRQAIKRGLLFSAALSMPRLLRSKGLSSESETIDLFCFGDWGSDADKNQRAVAQALQDYSAREKVTPHALLLLGDNFYGAISGGTESPRWKLEFEDMYPAGTFPGPCYAVLGNHDYDNQPGGDKVQLDYARKPGTRWKMPARWYRVELPAQNPLVTLLCMDTHYPKLSVTEIAEQQRWLERELDAPRKSPWIMVCGHHPVLSCGPHHGDSAHLAGWRELFNRKKVHAYLAGHEHDLQHIREKETFTDWFVSGGGGRALHPVEGNEATSFAREMFGFLHLTIQRRQMAASFVDTTATRIYTYEKSLDTFGHAS